MERQRPIAGRRRQDNDRLDGGTDGDTVRGGGGSDTMLDDESEIDESFAYWAEWVDAV